VDAFDPETVTFFSSTNQEATTNDYFLNSAANISFFFEENSFKADGTLVQDKRLCINKCGHALHDQDDKFRQFSRSDRMQAVYRSLGFGRPLPVQSMYIFKQPKIGGPVVPHQDRSVRTVDSVNAFACNGHHGLTHALAHPNAIHIDCQSIAMQHCKTACSGLCAEVQF
jgi:phytanoyl-CoA hydroxylase